MRPEQGDSRKERTKGEWGRKENVKVEGPRVTGSVLPSICCRP